MATPKPATGHSHTDEKSVAVEPVAKKQDGQVDLGSATLSPSPVAVIPVIPQSQAAQQMYDPRAASYDDSWHPDYSERFMRLVPVCRMDHVLCLACGTGLDALLAAEAVLGGAEEGDEEQTTTDAVVAGQVVAIDISRPMLDQAEEKLWSRPELLSFPPPRGRQGQGQLAASMSAPVVKFLCHDITKLAELKEEEFEGRLFDVLICSNAMVLFDDPAAVVRSWRPFLRPGGQGVLALDVCHEREAAAGRVLERVLYRMGVIGRSADGDGAGSRSREGGGAFPVPRAWLRGKESMKEILEREGFVVERMEEVERVEGYRTAYLMGDEMTADGQFEYITMRMRRQGAVEQQFSDETKRLFREEWKREADAGGGRVELVNAMYVYIARTT